MNASTVALAQMLAPQAASLRATVSTLLMLTSASAAVLAQMHVLLAHPLKNNFGRNIKKAGLRSPLFLIQYKKEIYGTL